MSSLPAGADESDCAYWEDVKQGIDIIPLQLLFKVMGWCLFSSKAFRIMMFMSGIMPDAIGTISIADVLSGIFLLHHAIDIYWVHYLSHFHQMHRNMRENATNVAHITVTSINQKGNNLLYSSSLLILFMKLMMETIVMGGNLLMMMFEVVFVILGVRILTLT